MKKILFVESGIYGGGSFTSLLKHLQVLERSRIQPVVVFFNQNDYVRTLENMNIDVYFVNDKVFTKNIANPLFILLNKVYMKGYWRFLVISFLRFLHKSSINSLISICKKEKIDAIHLNTEIFRDRIGLLVGAMLEIPVYSHLRSKYADNKIYYNPEYIRFANCHVRKYLSVSEDTKNFWVNKVGLDEQKFDVLNDYVSIKEYDAENFKILPLNGLNILCVANLLPVKNHFYLIDSMNQLLKGTNSKLYLLGKGEDLYIQELKTKIQSLELNDMVEFLGFKENIWEYIVGADIVVLFSKSEGLPNVVLEAMSQGAIMVATEVGGIPEIIENNENGFLVPLNNPSKAEEILLNILKLSEPKQKEIRINAHETIKEKFSEWAYQKKVTHLYE
jgi:glycosyltransferase involved in cell wall biosynthesis